MKAGQISELAEGEVHIVSTGFENNMPTRSRFLI